MYIPRYRIKFEHFRDAWENVQYVKNIGIRQGVPEKAFCRYDKDAVTISLEAGKNALKSAGIEGRMIGAIVIGSAS